MRSFVLTGYFVEQRQRADRSRIEKTHRFFSTYTMTRDVVHRIEYWSPRCWTIFCFSKEEKDWGYLDSDLNYTPWNEYIPDEIRVDKL